MRGMKVITLLALSLTVALAQAPAPQPQQQRQPDPRDMGGGRCADNPLNCADARNPVPTPDTVWLEEMTWLDVRDAIKAGKTTAIIPTGGMEPNGPWLVLGKHNYVLRTNCDVIARKLGNALCAPIIELVPEGRIDPPSGHMRSPGTISLREETFQAVLTDVASSLKQHGFKAIIFIGDSGGNQNGQKAVAEKLTAQWSGNPVVAHIGEYYTAPPGTPNVLRQLGVTKEGMPDEGLHDSPGITLNMMLTDPKSVRWDERVKAGRATINGVSIANKEQALDWARKVVDARAERTAGLIRKAIGSNAPTSKFFDAAGVQIHYVEKGQGEPIVLLHGIGGSVQSWIDSGVVDKLAVDHRVIAFDARGHGKSGKPHDPKQYGRQMPLDVVRLLDHLAIKQAHIVGYSMGAGTTSQMLTMHPERFLTATLAAGAGRFEFTAADARGAEQEASERERECISRTLIARLAAPGTPAPSEDELTKRSAACFADTSQDPRAVAAVTRSRGETVVDPKKAAAVTVPTLGIVGTLDPAAAALERLKKIRPSLQLVRVEGAVHSSAAPAGLMRQQQFVATLRAFISSRGRQLITDQ
jgi:pimeloyl-ACP methyl ester carboxylesterase/creatinine amidohydrolase/Fe(II)-dependent formamide hydrolase-like protein